MTAHNLLAWSLEIALLVAIADLAARALRLRVPGARLLYWQAVLIASLLLPLVGPWKHPSAPEGSVSAITILQSTAAPAHRTFPLEASIGVLLLAGILARAVWLAVGFRRLRRYRRQSQPFDSRQGAVLALSDHVSSPVTFGLFHPVVLLPSGFRELAPAVQEAILRHELLHVSRRDWLFTLAEEMVRAAFWFHPAIWWLLAEIGLAREQEVDRQVVGATQAREQYVDALLVIASGGLEADVAPASQFLRKRHLKQRVLSILKEVRMSKARLVSSLAAALGVLIAGCWLATSTFPLSAAPQAVADTSDGNAIHLFAPPGVRLSTPSTVIVEAKVGDGGSVVDAQVLAGIDALRKPALQMVLNAHRPATEAGRTEQISVVFEPEAGLLKAIAISGVTDSVRSELLGRLPVHEGNLLGPEQIQQANQLAREYGLSAASQFLADGGRALVIAPPPAHIRVGGNVMSAKVRVRPKPVYPALAKQGHIEGVVQLHALIGKDGAVENLSVISGHPLLVPSAIEAVHQWVYEPTMLNGEPVGVETEIDVNYTLLK